MKKILAMILALALVFALCACGESEQKAEEAPQEATPEATPEPTPEPTPEVLVLKVGESFQTEDREFKLTDFTFAQCLRNVMDKDAYMPVAPDAEDSWVYYRSNNPYNADADHIMLLLEFTQKNIGRANIGLGSERSFKIVYGDGYEFECKAVGWQRAENEFGGFSFAELEPLSSAVVCRAVFELPVAVKDNANEPLKLIVTFGETTCEYQLR